MTRTFEEWAVEAKIRAKDARMMLDRLRAQLEATRLGLQNEIRVGEILEGLAAPADAWGKAGGIRACRFVRLEGGDKMRPIHAVVGTPNEALTAPCPFCNRSAYAIAEDAGWVNSEHDVHEFRVSLLCSFCSRVTDGAFLARALYADDPHQFDHASAQALGLVP